MDWGYYCRTCGKSSEPMFDQLASLWKAYREAKADLDLLDADDTIVTDTLELKTLVFLAMHHGHDIWAECEIGVLRLGPRAQPYTGAALPQRFRPVSAFEGHSVSGVV